MQQAERYRNKRAEESGDDQIDYHRSSQYEREPDIIRKKQ